MVPRGPAPRQPILTFGRWNYLQGGITKIMNNLQDGLDMVTVSTTPAPVGPARDSLLTWCPNSTWESTRTFVHISPKVSPSHTADRIQQGRPQLLHIAKSRRVPRKRVDRQPGRGSQGRYVGRFPSTAGPGGPRMLTFSSSPARRGSLQEAGSIPHEAPPGPPRRIQAAHGRGTARFLYQGMEPLHDCSQVHPPSVPLPQPPLG